MGNLCVVFSRPRNHHVPAVGEIPIRIDPMKRKDIGEVFLFTGHTALCNGDKEDEDAARAFEVYPTENPAENPTEKPY